MDDQIERTFPPKDVLQQPAIPYIDAVGPEISGVLFKATKIPEGVALRAKKSARRLLSTPTTDSPR